jgi:membrane protein
MQFIKTLQEKPIAQYLLRLYQNLEEDYIGLLAAGVAFYFFMAAFPAIAALISLYGLFSDPVFISQQIQNLENFLPPESLKILADQAISISASEEATLGLGFLVGIVLAVYSTTRGVKALINGLNIAFNVKEKRNIFRLNSLAFTLTFGMMVYLLFALSLIAFMPAFFSIIHLPDYVTTPLLALRWPLLMLSAIIGLQILYYFAPAGRKKKWRWVSWGSFVAMLFWVGGSSLFSLFVSNFGNYNETYGSLGAVAVLLLWFWLNALTVLLGAEINASFKSEDDTSK